MLDVIIALIPILFAAWWAYGNMVLHQVGIAVGTALLTEVLFSWLLLKRPASILDGSAIVTAILLVLTISPVTPWYVVAFGASSAILFGKIVFGGLGKNVFNPALVGREFMTVFFASVMTAPGLWMTSGLVKHSTPDLFPQLASAELSSYLSSLVFKPTGAMGEYSIACIGLGGLYLLWRNRISWHIPFALLAAFTVMLWLSGDQPPRFSMAGILFGTIFMATDMPSSPTTPAGKAYYGMMMGIVLFLLIKGGVRHEYTSYAILLLNAFSRPISLQFRPRAWGEVPDRKKSVAEIFLLSMKIGLGGFAVVSLHRAGLIHYLVFIYIIATLLNFNWFVSKRLSNAI